MYASCVSVTFYPRAPKSSFCFVCAFRLISPLPFLWPLHVRDILHSTSQMCTTGCWTSCEFTCSESDSIVHVTELLFDIYLSLLTLWSCVSIHSSLSWSSPDSMPLHRTLVNWASNNMSSYFWSFGMFGLDIIAIGIRRDYQSSWILPRLAISVSWLNETGNIEARHQF